MWAPQVGGFGCHPLVAIDTMGDVGRSRHERAFTGPDDVAGWLHEVLGALGIDRAHLVGASYGGWLALNQALRRPEDVESVLLVEPVGLAPVHFARFLRWGTSVLLASLLPRPLRIRAARRLRMPLLADARAMRLLRRGQLSHRFRPEPSPLTEDELARITVPVTLLVAEHSEIHDSELVVERAQRHLPDVRSRIVPGAGHALPISHPEEVQQTWREAHADAA